MKRLLSTLAATGVLLAGGFAVAVPASAAPVNTVSVSTVDRLPGVAKTVKNAKKEIRSDLRNPDMTYSKRLAIHTLTFLGFSPKVSKKAVNSMSINWKKQAAKQAKVHLHDKYSTINSRSELIEALRDWSLFTKKQARHGANAAGL